MVCQTAKTPQSNQLVTMQINVTDLTAKEQRELFCDCISQEGFIGFAKKENGKQKYYTFTYEK
jgi:hypothetical protein